MIDAVVFDLDGLLLDTEQVWDDVREGLVRERSGRWHDRAQADMMGISSTEWSRYLHEGSASPSRPRNSTASSSSGCRTGTAEQLPLLDGAVEAVRRLAERWPLGLASSSNRPAIDLALDEMSVAELFRVTVSSEEVDRGKPAPDVYLEAARRLGVRPESAVAVEDSASGIRSAKAAGMGVIAIPNAHFPPPEDVLQQVDVRLESLAQLEPDVIERLSGSP